MMTQFSTIESKKVIFFNFKKLYIYKQTAEARKKRK